MSTLVTVLHVIVCLFLMLTVLLQSGKGGGMGAAFGGGNAATVFGGSGASGFLKRLTAIAGTIFMITSMVLAFLSSRNSADALDSYGKEQGKIAAEKEEAKARALKAAKQAGSGSGSGAMLNPLNPLTPGSNAPTTLTPPPAGSDTPATGSATTPAPAGSATTPAPAGSAAPAEKPAAPAEKPAAPAEKPAAGSAKPADKPAAPAPLKPLTPAPATPAPAGGGSNK